MNTSIGRNWYEVYLMVLTLLFAISAWTTGSSQETLIATFPIWSQNLWYGGLVVSALAVLAGIVMNTLTGLLIERAALLILTGICAGYGLVFFAVSSRTSALHASYVVVLVLAYAAVNVTRALQVGSELTRIRRELSQLIVVAAPIASVASSSTTT